MFFFPDFYIAHSSHLCLDVYHSNRSWEFNLNCRSDVNHFLGILNFIYKVVCKNRCFFDWATKSRIDLSLSNYCVKEIIFVWLTFLLLFCSLVKRERSPNHLRTYQSSKFKFSENWDLGIEDDSSLPMVRSFLTLQSRNCIG